MIKDLLDRVPTAGLPGRPVRHRRAGDARGGAPRRPRARPARCCAARVVRRRHLRRRADPADRRPGAHRRPACPASSPACTSSARRCSPRCCSDQDHRGHLGRGGAGHRRARRAHAWTASRSGTARRSPSSPRCSTRCTSSRSAPGRPPATRSGMSVVQLLVIAVICLVATAPDGVVLPDDGRDWAAIIYMALVAGALALLAQTWAQSQLSPTRTAIIMSMEPVFAAFFAVLLGGEDVDLADGPGRRDGAGRDARGRARAAPPGRGRGPAPRRCDRARVTIAVTAVRTLSSGPRPEPRASLDSRPWSWSWRPTRPTRTSPPSSLASRRSAGRRSSPRAWSARSSAWSATSTPSTTSTCAPSRASPTCTASPTPTSWSAASTIPTARRSGSGRAAQVPIGPETFTLIAGPCAVESRDQTLEAAQMAKRAGATLLRGGAFKPRTSPYAFQGLGLAGAGDPRRRRGGHRAAGGHRGRRRPRRRRRGRARRHAPGRHPQHGQLRAAPGGRHVRAGRCCSSAA